MQFEWGGMFRAIGVKASALAGRWSEGGPDPTESPASEGAGVSLSEWGGERRSPMRKTPFCLASAFAVGVLVAPVLAEAGTAYVVTNHSTVRASPITSHHHVRRRHSRRIYVVQRKVVEPSAVVSRELAEQPVYQHLAEVQIGNATPILLDTEKNYYRQGVNCIDDNQFLVRAQRLHRHLNRKGAYVVKNRNTGEPDQEASTVRRQTVKHAPSKLRIRKPKKKTPAPKINKRSKELASTM